MLKISFDYQERGQRTAKEYVIGEQVASLVLQLGRVAGTIRERRSPILIQNAAPNCTGSVLRMTHSFVAFAIGFLFWLGVCGLVRTLWLVPKKHYGSYTPY